MPSIQLTHYVNKDGVLTLDFSRCEDYFKYFNIKIGKENLPKTWISVTTDQPIYKFYNLNLGTYRVHIEGKTKMNEFIKLEIAAVIKSKTLNKLITWLNKSTQDLGLLLI